MTWLAECGESLPHPGGASESDSPSASRWLETQKKEAHKNVEQVTTSPLSIIGEKNDPLLLGSLNILLTY